MHIYRVDKFAVPHAARGEFLAAVRTTHDFLRTQPGFIRDVVLAQTSGPGDFNFVSIVEWESADSVEKARAAVLAMQRKANFDPQELRARLGIRADVGEYRAIDSSSMYPGP